MKIIFLGAPGSGKGTLSNILIERYGFEHVSTGDLFRKTINDNGPFHHELKSIMMSGGLVDDELTNQIVKNKILELTNQNKSFILDGYPRNLIQAKFLSKIIKVDYVLNVTVDKEILIKRITGRRICPTCKNIYNIYYKKPIHQGICDIDGALLIQRNDDDKTIATKRLEVFESQNSKLIEFYKKQNNIHDIINNDLNVAIKQIKDICQLK